MSVDVLFVASVVKLSLFTTGLEGNFGAVGLAGSKPAKKKYYIEYTNNSFCAALSSLAEKSKGSLRLREIETDRGRGKKRQRERERETERGRERERDNVVIM